MKYRQSAVIPYQHRDGHLEVLLITNNRRTRWVLPKGLVDEGLSAAESAAKEAFEEAGLRGVVSPEALGRYEYDKWGGTCVVEVFLMAVTESLDKWQESHRTRRWLPPELAANLVDEPELATIIRGARTVIETRGAEESNPSEQ